MGTWTSRCLLGDPVDPWITKMVTRDTKVALKVSRMTGLGTKSDTFQQAIWQQLPAVAR